MIVPRRRLPTLGLLAIAITGVQLVILLHVGRGDPQTRAEAFAEHHRSELQGAVERIERSVADLEGSLAVIESAAAADQPIRLERVGDSILGQQPAVLGIAVREVDGTTRSVDVSESVEARDYEHHTHLIEIAARRAFGAGDGLGTAGGLVGSNGGVLRAFARRLGDGSARRAVGIVVDMRRLFRPLEALVAEREAELIVRDPEGRSEPLSTLRPPADRRGSGFEAIASSVRRLATEDGGSVWVEPRVAQQLGLPRQRSTLEFVTIGMGSEIRWSVGVIRAPTPMMDR